MRCGIAGWFRNVQLGRERGSLLPKEAGQIAWHAFGLHQPSLLKCTHPRT